MKKKLMKIVQITDSIFTQIIDPRLQYKKSILVLTFHGIFLNETERSLNFVDPKLFISIENFSKFLEYSIDKDYTFISPNDILKGLDNTKNYILLTFDDGYYNNKHVLSILRKYKIPACFFISTKHVKYNKPFWWDVLYREGIKNNLSIKQIVKMKDQMKIKTSEKCEEYLIDLFGYEALEPVSDIDRPFSPSELKEFSEDRLIFLGNHTCNHNILSSYSSKERNSLILYSQRDIYDFTGITPLAISYPDGVYSKEIIEETKKIGLKLGFSGEFKKNYLPVDSLDNSYMKFGRFNFYGYRNSKDCIEFFNIIISNGILVNWIFKRFFH
ncbi:Polysaccharide deacetylase [uncultured archaeon]|nr:Polysaccharide deacetylase [uncultured archaeon]